MNTIKDLEIDYQAPMKMLCDNQVARHIVSNSVFQVRDDQYFSPSI
jgi:hypothetical protein